MIKPRKIQPEGSHIIIYGAPLSGKLSLAKLLESQAQIIDLADIRCDESQIDELDESACVIINCASALSEASLIKLRSCSRVVLTSDIRLELEGFREFWLDFLDYEEFCSIYQGHNAMGDYLLKGRAPSSAAQGLDAKSMQQAMLAKIGEKNLQVLATIAQKSASKISVAELFSQHIKRYQIGKNDFYKAVSFLQDRSLIFWLEHDRSKRVFLSDFGMKNALCFNKNFPATFSNLIACELRSLYGDLRCSELVEFYSLDAELGVISDAFASEEFARLRFKKIAKKALELKLKTVLFLSLNMSFSEQFAGINFIAMPLENWLLSKDEALI